MGLLLKTKPQNKFRLCRCLGLFMNYSDHTNYTLHVFHLAYFVQSQMQQFSKWWSWRKQAVLGLVPCQCCPCHPPAGPCSASPSPVGFWPRQVTFLPPNAFLFLQSWRGILMTFRLAWSTCWCFSLIWASEWFSYIISFYIPAANMKSSSYIYLYIYVHMYACMWVYMHTE